VILAATGTLLAVAVIVVAVALSHSSSKSPEHASATDSQSASAPAAASPADPPQRPSVAAVPVTNDDVLVVYKAHQTSAPFAGADGSSHRFEVSTVQGAQTIVAVLVSDAGKKVAGIDTEAESDAAVMGVRHNDPVAAVGVVKGSLVFVGGSEKTTGKAGFSLQAQVFRWNGSGELERTQQLKVGWVASEKDDYPVALHTVTERA
jgi:hypothetical protein